MWKDRRERKQVKRVVTPEKALEKLMVLCSKSEKSSADAMRLMQKWEVPLKERESILSKLVAERYIDDKRYVELYVREKARFSSWGGRKIADTLIQKGISRTLVANAIAEQLSDSSQNDKLYQAIKKRYEQLLPKEENPYKLKDKLFRFAASRGFDFDDIKSVIERVVGEEL